MDYISCHVSIPSVQFSDSDSDSELNIKQASCVSLNDVSCIIYHVSIVMFREEIRDLLNPQSPPLRIREASNGEIYVQVHVV